MLVGHFDIFQNCNNFVPLVPNYRVLKSLSGVFLLNTIVRYRATLAPKLIVHVDVRQDC